MFNFEKINVVELDATELFNEAVTNEDGSNVNWAYCRDEATFEHDHACEFILYLGLDDDELLEERMETGLEEAKEAGCTENFLLMLSEAYKTGAKWLLLYA